jgi:hypothetical protein
MPEHCADQRSDTVSHPRCNATVGLAVPQPCSRERQRPRDARADRRSRSRGTPRRDMRTVVGVRYRLYGPKSLSNVVERKGGLTPRGYDPENGYRFAAALRQQLNAPTCATSPPAISPVGSPTGWGSRHGLTTACSGCRRPLTDSSGQAFRALGPGRN